MVDLNKILSIFILLGFCLCSNLNGIGQSKSDLNKCEKEDLESYADSLRMLITKFKPADVIHLTDSLTEKYDDVICPALVRAQSWKGYAYEHLFEFDKAVEIYNEILKTAVKNGYTKEEIIIRMSLARIYEAIDRPELCEQYLDEIDKLFQNFDDKKIRSHYYVRVASFHRIHKDREVAKEYAQKAIDLGEESGRLGSLAGGNMILGMLTEDFNQSMELFKKAAEYMFEEKDYVGYLFQRLSIARRYMRNGEYDKTKEILNSVQEETHYLGDYEKIFYEFNSYLSQTKADFYEGLGEKDSVIVALKDVNKYSALFGDIANQEKINQLVLDNAINQEKEKIEAANRWNNMLYLGLFFLSGVIILLLKLDHQNRDKSKKIEEQTATISKQYTQLEELYNYQKTLLSEVHHRIKNNLQLIISLLTLQKAKLSNNMDGEILDMLSYRISSISLIHEQLYNLSEFDKIDINLYAKDLLKNFMALISERKVKIEYDLEEVHLNLETITPLGLIWSELISNSLKYNTDKVGLEIYFDLVKEGDSYIMHYHDNGVGYPDGQFGSSSHGMGYTIIQSLSRQLSAESNAYNDQGAHFKMEFQQKIISPI